MNINALVKPIEKFQPMLKRINHKIGDECDNIQVREEIEKSAPRPREF